MVGGAIAAQWFAGVWVLVFLVVYFAGLLAGLTLLANVLKKRGYPMWRGHLTTRSSGP
jgi:hypothetical protein